jgi:hypothetical protein
MSKTLTITEQDLHYNMLIEAPYKVGDTVSFKLSSGEEIVARLEKEDDKSYTLKKPMVLMMQQQGLGLAPFMFSVSPDGKFNLQATSVSCIAKTESEIAKQYLTTTSGIAL